MAKGTTVRRAPFHDALLLRRNATFSQAQPARFSVSFLSQSQARTPSLLCHLGKFITQRAHQLQAGDKQQIISDPEGRCDTVALGVVIGTGLRFSGQRTAFQAVGKAGARAAVLGVGLIPGRRQGGRGQQSLGKQKLPDGLDTRCNARGGVLNFNLLS